MIQPLRTAPLARPTARRGATIVFAGLLALTACGGSDEDAGTAAPSAGAETSSAPTTAAGSPTSSAPSSAPAETETTAVPVSMVDFDYELDETELAAGDYEFEVTNDGDASHNLIIEQDGEDVAGTEVLDSGGTETLSVTLEPGEYVFYCSVGNHRSMGMEITVTVS